MRLEGNLLQMNKAEAERKWREYVKLCKMKEIEVRSFYRKMKTVLYWLKKGYKIIDVREAILRAGLNEKSEPVLAIARLGTKRLGFKNDYLGARFGQVISDSWLNFRVRNDFRLGDFWSGAVERAITIVPQPPANVLKKIKNYKKSYYILFEVDEWKEIPRDPILLKRLTNNLFAVIDKWNLTKLERMVLGEFR